MTLWALSQVYIEALVQNESKYARRFTVSPLYTATVATASDGMFSWTVPGTDRA
jgi:hypothetical protein